MTISEFVDDGRAHPFKLNPGLIPLITKRVYAPWMIPREIVSNAYDQYILKEAEGRKPVIHIWISKKKRMLRFIDNATGILNGKLEDFMELGNTYVEGIGKFSIDSHGHAYINPKTKGQYHIAKGSFSTISEAVGDKVIFRSNNGTHSILLRMREVGWAEIPEALIENSKLDKPILPFTGMDIDILEPKLALLEIEEMKRRLSEWFAYMLAHKQIEIIITDKDTETKYYVYEPKDFKIDNEVVIDPRLRLESGAYITCRLEKTEKAVDGDNVQMFVKYVGITSIHLNYLLKGWVNCDSLSTEMNLSRNGFNQESDIYSEIMEKLDTYLESKDFVREEKKKVPRRNIKGILAIANKVQKICNHLFVDTVKLTGVPDNCNPKNPSATQQGNNKVKKEIEDREPRTDTGEEPVRTTPSTGKKKGKRKIKKKKTVMRKGGMDENEPNVKAYSIEDSEKDLLFFRNPESLVFNYGRPSSAIYAHTIGKPTQTLKLEIIVPLVVIAAIDQRLGEHEVPREEFKRYIQDCLDQYWGGKDKQ